MDDVFIIDRVPLWTIHHNSNAPPHILCHDMLPPERAPVSKHAQCSFNQLIGPF